MANYFKNTELIHIPVVTDLVDDTYPFKDSINNELNWWSRNSFLPSNAMMVSAYYGMDNIKNRRELRNSVFFIGDSGGFQIVKHRSFVKRFNDISKLNWRNVIEWQLAVADIGMTLDIPPRSPYIKSKFIKSYEESYEESLIESAKNAIEMHDYKDEHIGKAEVPDFKLFNVIHGITPNEMERWDRETTDNHRIEFDGYSSSAGIKDLLPLRLGFAIEHSKNKPYHILGASSPRKICLMAYANTYTETQVYFDSSTANMGRTKRMYNWYFNFGPLHQMNQKLKNDNINLTDICVCPICRHLQKREDIWNHEKTSGLLITLHNLYWMNNYTSFINELVKHEKKFRSYINSFKDSKKIFRQMEFLDDVNDIGLHAAWEKYPDLKVSVRK